MKPTDPRPCRAYDGEILTVRELAERLKISPRTVTRTPFPVLGERGSGRALRYYWPDVLDYLRRHRNGSW